MIKGSATTMGSLILIILLIGMVGLYAATINDMIDKEKELSLKKTEILKTKNTFYLVNRSLEITWFVSAVQNIFDAGSYSLGVPYWYVVDMQGNIVNLYRPSRAEGEETLVEYLNDNIEEYTDPVAGDVTLPDSVLISISDIESSFDYLEKTEIGCCAFSDGSCTGVITQEQCWIAYGEWSGQTRCCPNGACMATCLSTTTTIITGTTGCCAFSDGSCTTGITFEQCQIAEASWGGDTQCCWDGTCQSPCPPETDTITAKISQNLEVSYVDTVSRAVATTALSIPTVFLDMIEAGTVFVNAMILFVGNPPSYAYTHTNKEAYYLAVEDNLRNIALPLLETLASDTINIREIGLEERLAFVPNPGIPEYDAVYLVPDQAGLVLHSIAYCTIEEDNEGYYYHDEGLNAFIKRPFFLDVKADTYVSALDCSSIGLNFFGYEKWMDMACFNSLLYTCDILIPGENSNQNLRHNYCLTPEIECDDYTDVFAYCGMKLCQPALCSGLDYTPTVCCDEFCEDGAGCDCPCPDATPPSYSCDGGDPCYTYKCNNCYTCGCSPCSAEYNCPGQCCTAGTCHACPTTTTTIIPYCPEPCWQVGLLCCCYDPLSGVICY